jgi:hypothetical protein
MEIIIFAYFGFGFIVMLAFWFDNILCNKNQCMAFFLFWPIVLLMWAIRGIGEIFYRK